MLRSLRHGSGPVLLLATLLLAGCGEADNVLRGSISELFALEFDSVRARKQELQFLLEYLRETKGGTEKPCRLLLDTDGLSLGAGSLIKAQEFLDRVGISRVALDNESFPDLTYGELELQTFELRAGGEVRGEFYVMFVDGHTLRGRFATTVQEILVE